jgi:hypothetical protein
MFFVIFKIKPFEEVEILLNASTEAVSFEVGEKKYLIDELSSLLRVLEEDCSILGEDTIWMDGYFKVISGGEISQI